MIRQWVGILLCLSIGMGIAGCTSLHQVGQSPQDQPFFFIQMADPQFGMFTKNKDFAKETELFEQAIDHANRLCPAFVVVTGDLVNRPGDEAQKAEIIRIADTLDKRIPLYWVSGNHELTNTPTNERLLWYRKHFGQDWYAFEVNRCLFIVLNSTIIAAPELVEPETMKQLKWLKNTLHESAIQNYTHKIVFQHHPLFLKASHEKDQYFNIPQVHRRVYLDLFKTHGVKAIFAGHYHRNSLGSDGLLEMVTTGAVGKPLGDAVSGFRIVKVYPDRIEHRYYGLDEVPAVVAMENGVAKR